MSRLSINEANERLSNQNTSSNYINTFYLKNDKDHTIVRLLLEDVTQIEVHSIHEVKMTSKNGNEYRVQVDCHGNNCPLCREATKYATQKFPLVRKARDMVYIPIVRLYNASGKYEPTYEIFCRSTRWYRDELAGFAARYGVDGYVEVEKSGTGLSTTYKLYEARKDFDGKPLDNPRSLQELKADFEVKDDDICGRRDSLIKTWSAEEFEEFLETGTYPGARKSADENEEEDVKPRARSSNRGF